MPPPMITTFLAMADQGGFAFHVVRRELDILNFRAYSGPSDSTSSDLSKDDAFLTIGRRQPAARSVSRATGSASATRLASTREMHVFNSSYSCVIFYKWLHIYCPSFPNHLCLPGSAVLESLWHRLLQVAAAV
jgi:hypothetical protein